MHHLLSTILLLFALFGVFAEDLYSESDVLSDLDSIILEALLEDDQFKTFGSIKAKMFRQFEGWKTVAATTQGDPEKMRELSDSLADLESECEKVLDRLAVAHISEDKKVELAAKMANKAVKAGKAAKAGKAEKVSDLSPRAARREAMRQADIPTSQQPVKITHSLGRPRLESKKIKIEE